MSLGLTARGRPASPDRRSPSGFPRRGIEHASNSPHKLRAIEHASRNPPSASVSDKSGGKSERPGRFANGRARARLRTPPTARAGPREPYAGRNEPEHASPPLWMREYKWTRSRAPNSPHPARSGPLRELARTKAAAWPLRMCVLARQQARAAPPTPEHNEAISDTTTDASALSPP